MGPNERDSQTAQIVLGRLQNSSSVSSIAAVMEIMQSLDTVLPASDGVKWFNMLYLAVTRAIDETPHPWADSPWLTHLDITFAQLYFDALARSYTDPASVPRAWAALFESRYAADIQRVQFALAGMNAHINHDLPLAVLATCEAMQIAPDRGSKEYSDYEAVNGIIDSVEPDALRFLATGIAGMVAEDVNAVGRVLSSWNIDVARDTAWTNAELLWQCRDLPGANDALKLVMDRMTGFAGRALLA